jgi:hypothetical protein
MQGLYAGELPSLPINRPAVVKRGCYVTWSSFFAECLLMPRHAFITVTDYNFFPGTLATVSSVLEHQREADVIVVFNEKNPLSEAQAGSLRRLDRVRLLPSSEFAREGRYINAWELKAYAAHDLAGRYEVIVGIDSDCLLCGDVDDKIVRCTETGGFLGGRDGDGRDYDGTFQVYGFATPAWNPRYMSTSLYFCATTPANRQILKRWADCCSAAEFNGQGPYSGHGDQGVLNAVLFAENATGRVELLDNRLWSQHGVYWQSTIVPRGGTFTNLSADGARQRSFHCGGSEKFWAREHAERVVRERAGLYPYAWFLAMLWFGRTRNWMLDPASYLPMESRHLLAELVRYLPEIVEVYPPARDRWAELAQPRLR